MTHVALHSQSLQHGLWNETQVSPHIRMHPQPNKWASTQIHQKPPHIYNLHQIQQIKCNYCHPKPNKETMSQMHYSCLSTHGKVAVCDHSLEKTSRVGGKEKKKRSALLPFFLPPVTNFSYSCMDLGSGEPCSLLCCPCWRREEG